MTGIWQSIFGGTFAPVSGIIVCIAAAFGVLWMTRQRSGRDSDAAPPEQKYQQEDEHD